MILDYYGIDTMPIGVYSQLSTNSQILRFSQSIVSQAAVCELIIVFGPTHNATHCKTVLGPETIPGRISWVCHNDSGLLWNWYHPSPILLSVVNKLSDSRILAIHLKPGSCLWSGYNMAKRLHCKTLLGPENISDVISWVCPNDTGLLWNWYHPLHDA